MNNIAFDIKHLTCQYKGALQAVLHIEELRIERGKIVFFVGPSGVGKSTLLETLGLMNDTISKNKEGSISFYSTDGAEHSLKTLWQRNETIMAAFRRKYFSFIFQNTNLFSTISAIDNVNVVQLMKGVSLSQADKKTRAIFERLELPSDMDRNHPVTALSGGQRQRIAFARAMVSEFDVLFADEPTGNLDWFNAHTVMKTIKEVIHNNQSNISKRAAVIVSHDTELALSFADTIVFIEKDMSNKIGIIKTNSIYHKSGDADWKNSTTKYTRDEMRTKMREMYISTEEIQK